MTYYLTSPSAMCVHSSYSTFSATLGIVSLFHFSCLWQYLKSLGCILSWVVFLLLKCKPSFYVPGTSSLIIFFTLWIHFSLSKWCLSKSISFNFEVQFINCFLLQLMFSVSSLKNDCLSKVIKVFICVFISVVWF